VSLTNAAELDWSTVDRNDTLFRRKRLSGAAGGTDIGCSLYELPPGGRSWPYHYHTGNEEALFVLDGEGTLRLADDSIELAPNDYVALPATEEGAHRVVNDSDGVLRYLGISTMRDPDVTVYPDSDKIGIFAGGPPGGNETRDVHGYYRREDAVGYWSDEDSE
jgi:uncharacterized cupin superfamily protein